MRNAATSAREMTATGPYRIAASNTSIPAMRPSNAERRPPAEPVAEPAALDDVVERDALHGNVVHHRRHDALVPLRPRVRVLPLCAPDRGLELDKGVVPRRGRDVGAVRNVKLDV
jgi:hypothetical protein